MRRCLLVAFTALAVCAPAAGAQTPIATTERPTAVREYKGVAAFSLYDSDAGVYRLAISRDGAPPELVPVDPRFAPFDADVGPDSDRRPAIVYSRCEREAPKRRGCDVYRYSLSAAREDPIRNANSGASEYNPTIWRGRVAWVRSYVGRPRRNPVVYTRPLISSRARSSKRLPGIPTRRCSPLPGKGCSPTSGDVDELELYGRWLAQSVSYEYKSAIGVCGRREVRLVHLGDATGQVGDQVCGLNGQSWVGLSFKAGRLYVARYCAAQPNCGPRFGAYRYRLSSGSYEVARSSHRPTGFAYAGDDRAYEVLAPDTGDGYCGNSVRGTQPPCRLVLTDALDFKPVRAPR